MFVAKQSTDSPPVVTFCVSTFPVNARHSVWKRIQTMTSFPSRPSSSAALSFVVPRRSCARTSPSQEHFCRVGLDTSKLALSAGLPDFPHRPQSFQMLQGGKKFASAFSLVPLLASRRVGWARVAAYTKCCVFPHWSIAMGNHATGDLHSCALPPVPRQQKHLKEALSRGSVALRLSCGFRPD